MKYIIIGGVYGAYKVLGTSHKLSTRNLPLFDCKCNICGATVQLSSTFLTDKNRNKKCVCEKVIVDRELEHEYKMIKRRYGKVCLCGSCKHLFTCVRHTLNAVDKRFMLKYEIEKIPDRLKTRNVIIVYECSRFEFDWGNRYPNLGHKIL